MTNSPIAWNDLFLFSKVVEYRGFTAAGDALNLPKSNVSRRIARLEQQLDTRLLNRSARKLVLTDAGSALHHHCLTMLSEAEAGIEAVLQRSTQPIGQVRLSLPVALAEVASRQLFPRFMQLHPSVKLSIQATNRVVDLYDEKVDVVVRGLGAKDMLSPSSLIQACVCAAPWVMVASPAYIQQHGPIEHIGDLERLDTLVYAPNRSGETSMRLTSGKSIRAVRINTRLESDNLGVIKCAALEGLGICGLPLYMCQSEITSGALNIVLSPWKPKAGHLVVMFPSKKGLPTATRVLVDFLKSELPGVLAGGA